MSLLASRKLFSLQINFNKVSYMTVPLRDICSFPKKKSWYMLHKWSLMHLREDGHAWNLLHCSLQASSPFELREVTREQQTKGDASAMDGERREILYIASDQALHLRESREVTREQSSLLAGLKITVISSTRRYWGFVSLRGDAGWSTGIEVPYPCTSNDG